MAACPAISMYRLPTYYEEMAIPLPKCMYSLPSYFQTNSEMEVSCLILIACHYSKYFLAHVDFLEAGVNFCSSHNNFILFKAEQSQESSASIEILESRQEDILCELNGLRAVAQEMASRLGVSLPRPKAKVSHRNFN